MSWGECQLELLQYHFHTPSEHAFDGQRSAMEAHLVHRNKTTGEQVQVVPLYCCSAAVHQAVQLSVHPVAQTQPASQFITIKFHQPSCDTPTTAD